MLTFQCFDSVTHSCLAYKVPMEIASAMYWLLGQRNISQLDNDYCVMPIITGQEPFPAGSGYKVEVQALLTPEMIYDFESEMPITIEINFEPPIFD